MGIVGVDGLLIVDIDCGKIFGVVLSGILSPLELVVHQCSVPLLALGLIVIKPEGRGSCSVQSISEILLGKRISSPVWMLGSEGEVLVCPLTLISESCVVQVLIPSKLGLLWVDEHGRRLEKLRVMLMVSSYAGCFVGTHQGAHCHKYFHDNY